MKDKGTSETRNSGRPKRTSRKDFGAWTLLGISELGARKASIGDVNVERSNLADTEQDIYLITKPSKHAFVEKTRIRSGEQTK
jgi:hypothetical protein